MKDENRNASIPTPTFAYVAKLLYDKKLLTLLNKLRKNYIKDHLKSTPTIREQVVMKKKIGFYLHQKSIPLNFADVLYSLVVEKEPKYPLSPTISIEAAEQQVDDNFELLLITDKNGNPTDKQEIAIKIHANISIDELIKFIEGRRDLLNELMLVLKLPQIPSVSRWAKVRLALLIISMKDELEMTFSEICEKFKDQNEDTYLDDESSVKNLYYRYKKYLSSK